MNGFGRGIFSNTPTVVKNLLIINILIFFAGKTLQLVYNFDINGWMGLHYIQAQDFNPIQLVTYMFLHDLNGFAHIFFNMFAVWMFGRILEQVWGPKRFLIFYLVCGVGAGLIQTLVLYIELHPFITDINLFLQHPSISGLEDFISRNENLFSDSGVNAIYNMLNSWKANPNDLEVKANIVEGLASFKTNYLNMFITVGASGAVFGILLAFGMLFPNTQLILLFPPIPIKAKYLVILYGVAELIMGVTGTQSNVAHFAHLGGMLFGFILIKIWKKNTGTFY